MLNADKGLNNFMEELIITLDRENGTKANQNTPKIVIVKNNVVRTVSYENTTHAGIIKTSQLLINIHEIERIFFQN